MLLLTGQMEAAVEFLARVERLRAHAVHIGLALQELSLLRLARSPQAPLREFRGEGGEGGLGDGVATCFCWSVVAAVVKRCSGADQAMLIVNVK